MRFTLWIEAGTKGEATLVAMQQIADLGAAALRLAHSPGGTELGLEVRPTLDMPGTWLVDVTFPDREPE